MARILVVDDELDIVRVVVKTLEARGHAVDTGRDGAEAIDRVRAHPPDVLVIDLNLPRLDGLEVCRRLKADPATRAVRIVMLSTTEVSLTDAQLVDLGPDEYVLKPFVREVLINNVERLLKP
ncbi:MAG TPA: response regulator [Kofleriaceae bacterium]|jgi:CheY-like chemotaxis protein|nr:response regulator [Kofleriaceae bacterium]